MTEIIGLIEDIAREKAKNRIRLRVIDGNLAKSLYLRHEFEIIED